MTDISTLVRKNRSYRRYDERCEIPYDLIVSWVDTTRFTASARNLQPLKLFVSVDDNSRNLIFEHISWAGYLDNGRPIPGERPSAYIVLCNDTRLATQSSYDQGIVAQTLLLQAVEAGYGGCMFTSVRREALRRALLWPEYLDPQLVIALGKPIEEVAVVAPQGENIRYYRDEKQVHHVPKRSLEEILIQP